MNIQELEKYLSDLENLYQTGFFKSKNISNHVFYHKGMNLKEFISKGKEVIRVHLLDKKKKEAYRMGQHWFIFDSDNKNKCDFCGTLYDLSKKDTLCSN